MHENTDVLINDLDRIAGLDAKRIISQGGFEGFTDVEGPIMRAIELAGLMKVLRFDELHPSEFGSLQSAITQLWNRLRQAQEWRKGKSRSPAGEAKGIAVGLTQAINEALMAASHPLVRLFSLVAHSTQAIQDKVKACEDCAGSAVRSAHKATDLAAEAERLTASLREQAQVKEVGDFRAYFKNEAKRHRTGSVVWLILTIVMAAATIGVVLWFASATMNDLNDLKGEISVAKNLQILGARLVVVSVMYVVLVWCMRNHRSHQHLRTVNTHRSVALNTFEGLMKACGDAKNVKHAVLLEACRCMFAPTVTGFLGPEENTPSLPAGDLAKAILRG